MWNWIDAILSGVIMLAMLVWIPAELIAEFMVRWERGFMHPKRTATGATPVVAYVGYLATVAGSSLLGEYLDPSRYLMELAFKVYADFFVCYIAVSFVELGKRAAECYLAKMYTEK